MRNANSISLLVDFFVVLTLTKRIVYLDLPHQESHQEVLQGREETEEEEEEKG